VGEFVRVETDEHGVATLRLERAPVNALSPQMWDEIHEAAEVTGRDESVHAVVLWGGPKVFAAGADIKAMKEYSFTEMFARGHRIQDAFTAVARMPQITIAAINGYALGGGCELSLACDFRYAADNSQLGQPEILLGLIPGAGGTQRLTRLVGIQKAKELVYGGGFVKADEALAIGLVDKVLPPDDVYTEAVAVARRYAAGPYALRMAKKAIDEGIEMDLDSALRLETELFAATFATEDARTGMESFVENGPGKANFTRR
jgi:enoyl-CoA hydratase/carnithine racemase